MRDQLDGDVPPVRVPDPDADLDVLWHFALSINGYDTADITELAEAEQAMRLRSVGFGTHYGSHATTKA